MEGGIIEMSDLVEVLKEIKEILSKIEQRMIQIRESIKALK